MSVSIQRLSYRNRKIYWREYEELIQQINELNATNIIEVGPAIPDMTTTAQCSSVYYEYSLD